MCNLPEPVPFDDNVPLVLAGPDTVFEVAFSDVWAVCGEVLVEGVFTACELGVSAVTVSVVVPAPMVNDLTVVLPLTSIVVIIDTIAVPCRRCITWYLACAVLTDLSCICRCISSMRFGTVCDAGL